MKKRHIKTISEKYSGDVYDAAALITRENPKMDSVELFKLIPHIGYLRIHVCYENGNWWDDTNDDIVTAKILRVNETTVDICHYDSHHNQIAFRCPIFDGFHVEGNVLKNNAPLR